MWQPLKILTIFGDEKSHMGPCLVNMEAMTSLQCCFWPKIHEQAMKCEQVPILLKQIVTFGQMMIQFQFDMVNTIQILFRHISPNSPN